MPHRIFLVEDSESIGILAKILLSSLGHEVVLEASILEEALGIVSSGQLQEKEITLAIVDGNLSKGDHSCEDGRKINAAIKATNLPIKIIAFSGDNNPRFGDVLLRKPTSVEELEEAILITDHTRQFN